MLRGLIALIISLTLNKDLFGQVTTIVKTKQGVVYRVFESTIDSAFCNSISIKTNSSFSTLEELSKKEADNSDDKIILLNACINDSTGNCVGLLIANQVQKHPTNLNSGVGNFYLKPNGVLSFSKNDANIIQSSLFIKSDTVLNAIQSGPMLVINDTINSVFSSASTNLNFRSGVGIYIKDNVKRIVFAVTDSPVNFYEIASFLKAQYKCNMALSLESANSILFDSDIEVNENEKNKIVANYLKIKIPTPTVKKETTIQMELMTGGIYQVPIEINDVLKISFLLDSGASDVSISPDIALTLIKTGSITKKDYIGIQEYAFANGVRATSSVFYLKKIKIGDFVYKNVRASISTTITAPMLLGQSLLQKMGKISIDNNTHQLTITRK
jgi:clan AA aspartic protease (TIGR02281 family)